MARKRSFPTEQGFSLIEVLAAITIVSLMALAVLQSSLVGIRYLSRAQLAGLAQEIAQHTLEEYSSVDPQTFASGTTDVEEMTYQDKPFRKTVTFSTNADRSRNIEVTVESLSGLVDVTIEASNTYALRGQR